MVPPAPSGGGRAGTDRRRARVRRAGDARATATASAGWPRRSRGSGVGPPWCTVPEAATTALGRVDRADAVVLWRTVWGDGGRARRAPGTAWRRRHRVRRRRPDGRARLATVDVIDGIRSQGLDRSRGARDLRAHAPHRGAGRRLHRHDARRSPATSARLGAGRPVVPNGFDDATLVRSRARRPGAQRCPTDGLCRIGYAGGSRTHQRDLALAAEAVADVLRAVPGPARAVPPTRSTWTSSPSSRAAQTGSSGGTFVPLETLPVELARLDVNLAPLEVGNPFCEAKSELKFFEAALVDVPTVASPTEPYRASIRHGETGFLADTRATSGTRASAAWSTTRAAAPSRASRPAGRCCGPRPGATGRAVQRCSTSSSPAVRAAARPSPAAPPRRAAPARPRAAGRRGRRRADRLGRRRSRSSCPSTTTPTWSPTPSNRCARRRSTTSTWSWSTTRPPTTPWPGRRAGSPSTASRFNRRGACRTGANAGLAVRPQRRLRRWRTPPSSSRSTPTTCCCPTAASACSTAAPTGRGLPYPRIRHFGDAATLFPTPRPRLPALGPQRLVAATTSTPWRSCAPPPGRPPAATAPAAGWEDYDLWCRLAEQGRRACRSRRTSPCTASTAARCSTRSPTGATRCGRAPGRGSRRPTRGCGSTPIPQRSPPGTGPAGAPSPVPGRRPGAPPRSGGIPADRRRRPPQRHRTSPREEPASMTTPGGCPERRRRLLPLLRCPGRPASALERVPGDGACGRSRAGGAGRSWRAARCSAPAADRPPCRPTTTGNPLPAGARPHRRRRWPGPAPQRGRHPGGRRAVVEADGPVRATDVVVDAHRLPFADGTFDLVVAMNAFEHYRDPTLARQIRRVLAPAGWCSCTPPSSSRSTRRRITTSTAPLWLGSGSTASRR